MPLEGNDLAILTARFGCARFGASRFGFIPCPEDVKGPGAEEPGEYIYRESKPPVTEWTLVNEDCMCRDLCKLVLGAITVTSCPATNNVLMFTVPLTGVLGKVEGIVRIAWGDGRHDQHNYDLLENGDLIFSHTYFAEGTYHVRIRVWDERGCTKSQTVDVVIAAPMSVVAAVDDETPNVDQTVTFSATPSGGVGPFTYQWKFDADPLWDNLKNYWYLDETTGSVRRDSRRASHLTPFGGPVQVAGLGGRNAASFDNASQQYLLAALPAEIDFTNGATWVYAINVRTGAPTGGAGAAFFGNGQTFHAAQSFGTSNAGALYQFAGATGNDGATQSANVILGAFDTWYFVAGRYDPITKKVNVSLNAGAPAVTPNAAFPEHPKIILANGGVVIVGAGHFLGSPRSWSKSYIQALGLFDAYLSDAQITELYNGGNLKFFAGAAVASPTWAYATAGSFTATVTVTDSRGCTATDTIDVTVADTSFSPSFTWSQGAESSNVIFTPDDDGLNVLSIDMDFGEGLGYELDIGTGPLSNSYGSLGEDATYTVKRMIHAVEGDFEIIGSMTTNWAAGQSGSAP